MPMQDHTSETRSCPSRAQLQSLLCEELDDQAASSISDHLGTCDDCRAVLEDTAGDPSWWHDAHSFLSVDEPTDQSTAQHLDDISEEIVCWLGPTDDPQSLGRIGRYEITGIIGAGSMGVVLKAHEAQLKRYVAIKVLLPILAHNGAARKRFAREARAAAAVNHQHVVPIYGVDEFNGLPYLVMQYVAGESLAGRIQREGPLQANEVARIALQSARALAAAHEQGLVHRDIKPANILLENGIERAMVTDFGLARVADDAQLTQSGMITGTPQFMAPEQAMGTTVDARSDLFSLGAAMYAMCTGRPPFRADTVFGLLKKVCEASPRPIREINPDVPEWLVGFIDKLIAKQPEDRFATAHKVAEVLTQELAHLQNPAATTQPVRSWQVAAAGPRRSDPITTFVRRHWLNAALLVATVVCVLVLSRAPVSTKRPLAAPMQDRVTSHGNSSTTWEASPAYDSVTNAQVQALEQWFYQTTTQATQDAWLQEADQLNEWLDRLEQQQSVDAF